MCSGSWQTEAFSSRFHLDDVKAGRKEKQFWKWFSLTALPHFTNVRSIRFEEKWELWAYCFALDLLSGTLEEIYISGKWFEWEFRPLCIPKTIPKYSRRAETRSLLLGRVFPPKFSALKVLSIADGQEDFSLKRLATILPAMPLLESLTLCELDETDIPPKKSSRKRKQLAGTFWGVIASQAPKLKHLNCWEPLHISSSEPGPLRSMERLESLIASSLDFPETDNLPVLISWLGKLKTHVPEQLGFNIGLRFRVFSRGDLNEPAVSGLLPGPLQWGNSCLYAKYLVDEGFNPNFCIPGVLSPPLVRLLSFSRPRDLDWVFTTDLLLLHGANPSMWFQSESGTRATLFSMPCRATAKAEYLAALFVREPIELREALLTDSNGYNAFHHYASANCETAVAGMLAKIPTLDINARGFYNGSTPLLDACAIHGAGAKVAELLRLGADWRLRNTLSRSAFGASLTLGSPADFSSFVSVSGFQISTDSEQAIVVDYFLHSRGCFDAQVATKISLCLKIGLHPLWKVDSASATIFSLLADHLRQNLWSTPFGPGARLLLEMWSHPTVDDPWGAAIIRPLGALLQDVGEAYVTGRFGRRDPELSLALQPVLAKLIPRGSSGHSFSVRSKLSAQLQPEAERILFFVVATDAAIDDSFPSFSRPPPKHDSPTRASIYLAEMGFTSSQTPFSFFGSDHPEWSPLGIVCSSGRNAGMIDSMLDFGCVSDEDKLRNLRFAFAQIGPISDGKDRLSKRARERLLHRASSFPPGSINGEDLKALLWKVSFDDMSLKNTWSAIYRICLPEDLPKLLVVDEPVAGGGTTIFHRWARTCPRFDELVEFIKSFPDRLALASIQDAKDAQENTPLLVILTSVPVGKSQEQIEKRANFVKEMVSLGASMTQANAQHLCAKAICGFE